MTRISLCVWATITVTAGLGLAARADPQQTSPTKGQVSLEEIIVTAEKRSENIQTVPIAVTAMSATQLGE